MQILTYGRARRFPSGLHKSWAGRGAQRSRQAWPGNSLKAGRGRLSCSEQSAELVLLTPSQPQFYRPRFQIDFQSRVTYVIKYKENAYWLGVFVFDSGAEAQAVSFS